MNRVSEDILYKLIRGNRAAFNTVYEVYSPAVFDVAFKILRDRVSAEEVVQECFVKLWLNREVINPAYELWYYLYVMCKRLCFNVLRNERVAKEAVQNINPIAAVNDVEEGLHYTELQNLLQRHIDNLPEKQRIAFYLSREKGLSHQEISYKMGISQNTVKNHISQALKYLRKKLMNIDYTAFLFFFLFF
ncbi:RNA polymerase sigma-70 factor [Sphingobacterium chuzhouense]|uniref:RNA polymerase sigma-70 factor n=1 Tax=Sphingobacterium chuzhouense TaxID=1742264 RepID=A0ABR7XNB9_9SPHI|nr:RNA polymerase sigma-70 factor [Sphingobacterium chuzhouense]MBD1420651.1 RNA polymerase sigma-70 factor [Sphingobacterium chuzhouense]